MPLRCCKCINKRESVDRGEIRGGQPLRTGEGEYDGMRSNGHRMGCGRSGAEYRQASFSSLKRIREADQDSHSG